YGVTKCYGEQAVKGVVLRLSNVYGGVNDHPDRVVPAFMRAALIGETAHVNGDRGAFDFVHVDDVVRAIDSALQADARATYNVVTGVSTRLLVLALRCGEVNWRGV